MSTAEYVRCKISWSYLFIRGSSNNSEDVTKAADSKRFKFLLKWKFAFFSSFFFFLSPSCAHSI